MTYTHNFANCTMKIIALLQSLYENSRYAELIAQADGLPEEQQGFAVQFLKLRSYFQLGAYQDVATGLPQLTSGTLLPEERVRLALWNAHWRALLLGTPQDELERIQQSIEPAAFPTLTPQYDRTLATLQALAIHYYQAPQTGFATILEVLHRAQAGFLDQQEPWEYINCLIQEANIRWQLDEDTVQAQLVYQRAEEEAIRFNQRIQQADIQVKLAQFMLTQTRTTERSTEPIEQLFAQPERLYTQANHPLGLATIQWNIGKLREQDGFSGRGNFQQALELFTEAQDKGGIAEALASLSQSYLTAGQLTTGSSVTETLVVAAQDTGYPIRIANAYLTLAEYHARTGVYAQALFYAQKAQALMNHPATKALFGLNLSQFYLRINQNDQALSLCEQTIKQLQGAGDSLQLSVAYNVLGTTHDALGHWSEAMRAYETGLSVDERLGVVMPRLEKQINRQWTQARQAYQHHQPISPQLYAEVNSHLEAAFAELEEQNTPEALNLQAQILQIQSNIAQFAGRFTESLTQLERAADLYGQTNRLMQAATTRASLGLAAWELARRGDHAFFDKALTGLTQASAYFERENMKEQAWSVQFNLAACWWDRGVMTRQEMDESFRQATLAFHRAADTIDFIRFRFADRDLIQQDAGKISLAANKEKVYANAIRFHLMVLKNTEKGLYWVERFKGRTLTEMLASVYLPTDNLPDSPVGTEEAALRQQLRDAADQEVYYALLKQLRALWHQMKDNDSTRQYARLRLGEPIGFAEIKRYLG